MKYRLLILLLAVFIEANAQLTVVEWNFPAIGTSAANNASTTPNNIGKTLITAGGTAAVGYGTNTGAYNQAAWCSGWDNGNGTKFWEIEFNTTGLGNLDVSSKQRSSNTGPRDWKIQYKIGLAGVYVDLPGASGILNADNFTTTTAYVNQVPLPAACNNQPSVYLRWIMTSNTSVGGAAVAAGGTSRIDELVVNCNPSGYYRTIASGSWKNKAVWQYSADNITWIAADTIPTYGARTITIRNGHTVNIDTLNYWNNNSNLRIDEVVVDAGGQLNMKFSHLHLNNGAATDITINGTWMDSLPSSTTHYLNSNWIAGTTWTMGANGTFIKTLNSVSSVYQNNYNGGIATIPATGQWILRKTAAAILPTMTTANMFYPNLSFENVSGSPYNATAVGTYFFAANPCTVKGNLHIAGPSAANAITVVDTVYNNALNILGNMTINQFCTFNIRGDSVNVFGNLIVNGLLTHNGTLQRAVKFLGGAAQTVSGTGTIIINRCEIRKSSNDVNVTRDINIDANLNCVLGRFFTAASPNGLIIMSNASSATSQSNNSFVHGPLRKNGNTAFTFPIGKNNLYRQCGLGVGGGAGTTLLWSEDFNNGCTEGCYANTYVGPNGAWTQTILGGGAAPNNWFVSCAENGQTSGSCGSGCGSDATLHVGANPGSYCTCVVCTALNGDCGAAYDACSFNLCGGSSPAADKRIESPLINLTGQSNINVAFRYIEGGQTTLDNATFWYFDGTAWIQVADMAKTTTCGGGQGRWTQFTTVLPAAANNNPNVKIGFRWVNNIDGTGTDPSFAVDSVRLFVTGTDDIFTAEYFLVNPQTLAPCLNNRVPTLSAISCSEYWQIDRQAGSTGRTVTLSWVTPSPSCNVFVVGDLRVARCDGINTWQDHGNGGTTGTLAAGTITSSGPINTFSPFTIATVPTPLPVRLFSFNAVLSKGHVDCKWQTLEEIDAQSFVVQRANNYFEFADVVTIPAKGNNSSYEATDLQPYKGRSYYRLKMIDISGVTYYSNIEVVLNASTEDLLLNYTYNQEYLHFAVSEDLVGAKARICIFNNFGKQIYCTNGQLQAYQSFHIPLPPSVYLLTIDTEYSRIVKKIMVY
ncbi:MAG: hypothetical protein IPO27_13235 [Bacteroidetes bacterium]|nr:hypothetical protein [Bacteroidota bacterium]